MLFLDQNSCSFQWYTFCAGKWIQLFTETVRAFNLHFQDIRLNLQENKVHHSKEHEVGTVLETSLRFYIYFVFVHTYMISAFEDKGMHTIRAGPHICVPHISTSKP
jgi:hypothetical protein